MIPRNASADTSTGANDNDNDPVVDFDFYYLEDDGAVNNNKSRVRILRPFETKFLAADFIGKQLTPIRSDTVAIAGTPAAVEPATDNNTTVVAVKTEQDEEEYMDASAPTTTTTATPLAPAQSAMCPTQGLKRRRLPTSPSVVGPGGNSTVTVKTEREEEGTAKSSSPSTKTTAVSSTPPSPARTKMRATQALKRRKPVRRPSNRDTALPSQQEPRQQQQQQQQVKLEETPEKKPRPQQGEGGGATEDHDGEQQEWEDEVAPSVSLRSTCPDPQQQQQQQPQRDLKEEEEDAASSSKEQQVEEEEESPWEEEEEDESYHDKRHSKENGNTIFPAAPKQARRHPAKFPVTDTTSPSGTQEPPPSVQPAKKGNVAPPQHPRQPAKKRKLQPQKQRQISPNSGNGNAKYPYADRYLLSRGTHGVGRLGGGTKKQQAGDNNLNSSNNNNKCQPFRPKPWYHHIWILPQKTFRVTYPLPRHLWHLKELQDIGALNWRDAVEDMHEFMKEFTYLCCSDDGDPRREEGSVAEGPPQYAGQATATLDGFPPNFATDDKACPVFALLSFHIDPLVLFIQRVQTNTWAGSGKDPVTACSFLKCV